MSRISRKPDLCSGAPTLDGRRLTVYHVVSRVALEGREATAEDMEISNEAIDECLRYCAALDCVEEGAGLPFCQHCQLDHCPVSRLVGHAEAFRETGDPAVLGLEMTGDPQDSSFTWLLAAELRKPHPRW